MTAVDTSDWEDVVETLQRDIAVVSAEDSEDSAVRTALDEAWTIVDAAEDRVGSVDAEQIAEVLDIDVDEDSTAGDVESIPREFVRDDPQRAAELRRLVTLVTLDESSDYDFGRLWNDDDGGGTPTGNDGADRNEGTEADSPSNADDDASSDDFEERLRSELGEAFSDVRDHIQDAREGLHEASDRSDGSGAETERSETGGLSASSGRRSTGRNRRLTTFSTLPSDRHDVGTLPHVSTVPGQGGRATLNTSSGDGGREGSNDSS